MSPSRRDDALSWATQYASEEVGRDARALRATLHRPRDRRRYWRVLMEDERTGDRWMIVIDYATGEVVADSEEA